MSETDSKEEHILRLMKRVLTDVAKETFTRPGFKHPLSDKTILSIRDCLALIASRERELAESNGRSMNARPRFADEPKQSHVVQLHPRPKKNQDDQDDEES